VVPDFWVTVGDADVVALHLEHPAHLAQDLL
jgi:hypothetical protein